MSNIENGDPKAEKGPHGDLGLQMGTHVEAVAPVSKDALERLFRAETMIWNECYR